MVGGDVCVCGNACVIWLRSYCCCVDVCGVIASLMVLIMICACFCCGCVLVAAIVCVWNCVCVCRWAFLCVVFVRMCFGCVFGCLCGLGMMRRCGNLYVCKGVCMCISACGLGICVCVLVGGAVVV